MRERIQWADAARGIAILLVVIGHTCPPPLPTAFIYACHMPLFFMLSGLFFRADKPLGQLLETKARTLLVPFVIYNLVLLASDWCIVALSPNPHDPVVIPNRLLGTLFAMRHGSWSSSLWFLPCLFVAQMLMALCHKMSGGRRPLYLALCLLLTMAGIGYNQMGGSSLPFSADVALLAVFFLLPLAGTLMSSAWAMAVSGVFYVAATLFNHHWLGAGEVHVDMSDSILGCWPVFYVGGLTGSCFIMAICQRFRMPQMFMAAGRNSLVIYCLHRIPLNLGIAFTNLIPALNTGTFAAQSFRSVLLVVFTMLCLWPATVFVNRWLPWTVGKKRGQE